MKKLLLAAMVAVMGVTASAQQKLNIPEAVKGQQYGSGVSEEQTFDVYSTGRIKKALEKSDKLDNIIIQAKVSEVCEKKGCWLTLVDNDTRFMVKMKDYAFFLPQSMVGKTVLLHANAEKKTTPVKELQHYAEDSGASKEDIAKITEPQTEIRILAQGIKVVD